MSKKLKKHGTWQLYNKFSCKECCDEISKELHDRIPEMINNLEKNLLLKKEMDEKKQAMSKELKKYEIWQEGDICTGMEGETVKAKLIGEVIARSFIQACHIVKCQEYLKNIDIINDPNYKGYVEPDRWDYDPINLMDWGCRLFDNEEDARKSFG